MLKMWGYVLIIDHKEKFSRGVINRKQTIQKSYILYFKHNAYTLYHYDTDKFMVCVLRRINNILAM